MTLPKALSPKEIILVDDDDMQHFIIQKYFEASQTEYFLRAFHSGNDFLSHMREVGSSKFPMPEIVLLDIRMPNIDGFETLKRVRSDSQFANLPIILMFSNSDAPSDIEKSQTLGANGFQTKPSSTKELDTFFSLLLHKPVLK
jgi:CheY-like chemotaxis protein